jgi:hypothetical protein
MDVEKLNTRAGQTPLVDSLRSVPIDYRAVWTDSDGVQATHFIPIGKHCHEAAEALLNHEWPPQDGDKQIDEVMDAIRQVDVGGEGVG